LEIRDDRLRDLGRPWTRGTVHQVLTNEKYIGNNVYNRVSFKLKNKRVVNHPDMWIRADGAFAAIVDSSVFQAAQRIIQARCIRLTDEEMLVMKRNSQRANPAGHHGTVSLTASIDAKARLIGLCPRSPRQT
jgi:hypothetical protein